MQEKGVTQMCESKPVDYLKNFIIQIARRREVHVKEKSYAVTAKNDWSKSPRKNWSYCNNIATVLEINIADVFSI